MNKVLEEKDFRKLASEQDLAMDRVHALMDGLCSIYQAEAQILRSKEENTLDIFAPSSLPSS